MSTENVLIPKSRYDKLVTQASKQQVIEKNLPEETVQGSSGGLESKREPKSVTVLKRDMLKIPDEEHDAVRRTSDSGNKENRKERSFEEIIGNHEQFLPPGQHVKSGLKIYDWEDTMDTVQIKKPRSNSSNHVSFKIKKKKVKRQRAKPYSKISRKWVSVI